MLRRYSNSGRPTNRKSVPYGRGLDLSKTSHAREFFLECSNAFQHAGEPMICPACDYNLTPLTVGKLTVDVCQGGCGGIWFDNFELQKVDEPQVFEGASRLHIPR